MDDKMLGDFKEKLRQKALSLTELVQRSDAYSREKDPDILDIADQALESYTRDFIFSKSSGDRQLLLQIRQALARIEDDSFGICVHCEEPIEPRRLEAVPWAQYCLKCQALSEKGMLDS
jgi:DnaK suppressor protein